MSTPTLSPEQKALQILATFRPLVGIMAHKERTEKAKQCAIIAVKEIIQVLERKADDCVNKFLTKSAIELSYEKTDWESVLDCLNKM